MELYYPQNYISCYVSIFQGVRECRGQLKKVEAQMYGFFWVLSLVVLCLGWGHRMTPGKVKENPQDLPVGMWSDLWDCSLDSAIKRLKLKPGEIRVLVFLGGRVDYF